jgi:methane/ammonia monooxygenase subunit C
VPGEQPSHLPLLTSVEEGGNVIASISAKKKAVSGRPPDGPVERPSERNPNAWRVGWAWMFGSIGLISIASIGLRIYQGYFTWRDDASFEGVASPYWSALLIVELVIVTLLSLGWWGWLLRSGSRLRSAAAEKPISQTEEVRRIAVFWGLIGATSLATFFTASFFAQQDAVWQQMTIGGAALTPNHLMIFFWAFPLGVTMSVGTCIYARTRLPKVYPPDKGFPWSFAVLMAAPATAMMQATASGWVHSAWITEETFAAPLRWPFVTYGWLAIGVFALWTESLSRLLQIEDETAPPEASPTPVASPTAATR